MRRRGAAADAAADDDIKTAVPEPTTPRRRSSSSNNKKAAAAPTTPTTPRQRQRQRAPSAQPHPTSSSCSRTALALTLLLYALLFLFVRWRFFWTPKPLPFPSSTITPPHHHPLGPPLFTEGGARRHVDELAGPSAPPRQVSAPGLRSATTYLARECARVQEALENKAGSRARVRWAEQTVGPAAFATSFLAHRFTNAYRRLTNVLCLLEPLDEAEQEVAAGGSPPPPAVVLVAHHDAPVASPGAGDDASQVAVMLELLRAWGAAALTRTTGEKEEEEEKNRIPLPKAPILFVFNGGEEPLCQAAHGFAQRHRRHPLPPELALASTGHPPQLGAFINLESIGPGGVPIVFQHSGAWTVRAYARAAPVPRGSGAAQDAFDLNLVVGETDYSRLSYQKPSKDGGGWLPGLDVAHIADGAAYHTDRDAPDRLRGGVLQETGEAVGAAVGAMAAELAEAAALAAKDGGKRLEALVRPGRWDESGGDGGKNGGENDTPNWRQGGAHRAVFFSVGSAFMVRYGRTAALFLHAVVPPALIAYLTWLLASRSASSGLSTAASVGRAALRATRALVLAVAAPAAFGALRAALSGVAIAWYSSHPLLAALIYFPVAAAAVVWAASGVATEHEKHPNPLPTALLGAAAMNGLSGALLTWAGFGCAFIFAAWAYAGLLAAGVAMAFESGGVEEKRGQKGRRGGKAATTATTTAPFLLLRSPKTAPLVLISASIPALIGVEQVVVFSYVLGGRMNLSGATAGVAAADAAIGAIAGAGVAACTGGVVAPLVCRALGSRSRARAVAAGMVAVAVVAALWASVGVANPYSPAMPKRLLLSRVHFLEEGQEGGVRVARSGWAFGGTDPNPVEPSVVAAMLRPQDGALSSPDPALRRIDPSSEEFASLPTRHPLAIVYPVDAMADVALFVEEEEGGEDEQEEPRRLPSVRLLSDRVAVAGPGDVFQQHRELELVATSPAPCWGLLNVTVFGGGGGSDGGAGGGGKGGEEAATTDDARLLWWSLTPDDDDGPASHVRHWAGGGSVREHVVRWTSEEGMEEEEEAGAITGPRLPLALRVWPADARVRVELHVAPLVGGPRDAARERMVGRLPEWAALTWESTTYIGAWEF